MDVMFTKKVTAKMREMKLSIFNENAIRAKNLFL